MPHTKIKGETRARKDRKLFILITKPKNGLRSTDGCGTEWQKAHSSVSKVVISEWYGIYTNTETQLGNNKESVGRHHKCPLVVLRCGIHGAANFSWLLWSPSRWQ